MTLRLPKNADEARKIIRKMNVADGWTKPRTANEFAVAKAAHLRRCAKLTEDCAPYVATEKLLMILILILCVVAYFLPPGNVDYVLGGFGLMFLVGIHGTRRKVQRIIRDFEATRGLDE